MLTYPFPESLFAAEHFRPTTMFNRIGDLTREAASSYAAKTPVGPFLRVLGTAISRSRITLS